jgi:hypothetical protein
VLLRLLLTAAFLAPIVWALVDAVRRGKAPFVAAGRNRTVWIAILIVALIVPPVIGSGIGVWYLVAVRPKVAAAGTPALPADER